MNNWYIYQPSPASGEAISPHEAMRDKKKFPEAPPWRQFEGNVIPTRPHEIQRAKLPPHNGWRENDWQRARTFQADDKEAQMVNAALFLRRPLLITGKPGTGKSSLAYAVAYQLQLGPVLRWSITSRTILQDGLYSYDAIGRLHEASLQQQRGEKPTEMIGKYIRLRPLGTALLPTPYPRVLLIDEVDKSDIDLPNDLLNVFEEGEYEIPELARLAEAEVAVRPHDGDKETVPIQHGRVLCRAFPLIVLTSNGERELPAAFLRRCLHLEMGYPLADEKIQRIVHARFPDLILQDEAIATVIDQFKAGQSKGLVTNDQLLNALHLVKNGVNNLNEKILRNLADMGG